MIKLFSHENRIIVFNLKNILEAEGIETLVVNEFASGGVGDLAAFDTWPELWLRDEARFDEASGLLQSILEGKQRDDWFCRGCQEKNGASFQICWNCGRSYE